MPPARKTTSSKKTETKPAARAGRPRKLEIDPELQGRITAYIRAGAFPERAAVAAGVSERSHYSWVAKGIEEREHREDGKKPRTTMQVYLDYLDAVERAIAEAEVLLIGKVTQGGAGWQAQLAILERRFRDRWSAKAPTNAAGTVPTSSAGRATTLDQLAERRGQRRVKKTG